MAKSFKKHSGFKPNRATFFITAGVIVLITIICYTGLKIPPPIGITIRGVQEISLGIDINGGFEAVLVPKNYTGTVTKADMESAKIVVENRLDSLLITEREIFLDDQNRLVVRVPWANSDAKNNATEIINKIGVVAALTFKDPDGKPILTGEDLVANGAYAALDQNTNAPVVVLKLNASGKTKFAEATARLIGQRISINLDDKQISDPNVKEAITGGEATISPMETLQAAKDLAAQINAGALKFALEPLSSNEISAYLGHFSLDKMVVAGEVAFLLICLFMLLYYRLPGFVAIIALLAQVVGQLLAISAPGESGFILTLPGIAAIILSIGMGVDANIIITERIKEEINAGNPLKIAIRNGFDRAFSAVLDGNVTVAIVAILLMIFGSGSFFSFGYSLLTGVILNGLCGVTATRLMIGSLSQYPRFQSKWLYGGEKVKG